MSRIKAGKKKRKSRRRKIGFKLSPKRLRQLKREHAKDWVPVIKPILDAIDASLKVSAKDRMRIIRCLEEQRFDDLTVKDRRIMEAHSERHRQKFAARKKFIQSTGNPSAKLLATRVG
jgi:hypothetical protein